VAPDGAAHFEHARRKSRDPRHRPIPNFLYGVPRSDYQTVISGADIDDYGLAGAESQPVPRRHDAVPAPGAAPGSRPYGFPPIEQALAADHLRAAEAGSSSSSTSPMGTIPAVYISPGDPNMTPTQIKELQDALNGIAGDPAYHL